MAGAMLETPITLIGPGADGSAHLLQVGQLLVDVGPPAAVLLRPGRRRPPGVGEGAVPGPEHLEVPLLGGAAAGLGHLGGQLGGQPLAEGGPEGSRRVVVGATGRGTAVRGGRRWLGHGGRTPVARGPARPRAGGAGPRRPQRSHWPPTATSSRRERRRYARRPSGPPPADHRRRARTRRRPHHAGARRPAGRVRPGADRGGDLAGRQHRVRRRLGGLRWPAPGPVPPGRGVGRPRQGGEVDPHRLRPGRLRRGSPRVRGRRDAGRAHLRQRLGDRLPGGTALHPEPGAPARARTPT